MSGMFNSDRDGNARPTGGNWDIGAYQYGSGGGTSLSTPSNFRLSNLKDVKMRSIKICVWIRFHKYTYDF